MSWKDDFPKENRYFETENGILYCGDCLEILQDFPKESIDLVFTDPPYLAKFKHLYYESARLIQRILKQNTFAIYYASDYWFDDIFPKMLNYLNYFGLFHLELPGQNTLLFPRNIIVGCKTIMVFTKGKAKPYRRVRNITKSPERKTGELHKWQQSVEPAIYLINAMSKEGDIVLDPFIGSGTTLEACERLNRKWIGIEINEEYCKITKQRILKELPPLLGEV